MGFEVARYWRKTRSNNNFGCDKKMPGTPIGSWEFRGAKEPVVTEELIQRMAESVIDSIMRAITIEGYRQQFEKMMRRDGAQSEDYGGGK